jgi:hypothetical protein
MSASNTNTGRHEFISHHSGVDTTEFAMTVGFSRDPADESSLDGLLLQRGRGIEDDTPGLDGVYLEIPIQRHVVYGGITQATLRRDNFSLRLDDRAAREMGGFNEVFVRFDLPDDKFKEIRDALRFVFKGCPCYHEEHETAA